MWNILNKKKESIDLEQKECKEKVERLDDNVKN